MVWKIFVNWQVQLIIHCQHHWTHLLGNPIIRDVIILGDKEIVENNRYINDSQDLIELSFFQ